MHSQHINETTFHHNGDMSGEVIIVREGVEIRVPAKDLLRFVTYRAVDAVIARLEQIDPEWLWNWLSKS